MLDSTRGVRPLQAADDAVVIDTTGRSIEEIVDEIVGHLLVMLYRFVRLMIIGVCKLLFRVTFEGTENIPANGRSCWHPCTARSSTSRSCRGVTRRRMRYMGKAELWKNKWLARADLRARCVPCAPRRRPTARRSAARIEVIEGGEPLVMFPEGTRRSGPVIEDLFEGAAYVAARTGVPIVPVGIGGSERAMQKGKRLPRPVKVHIIVGKPIPAPAATEGGRVARRAVHELTAQLETALQPLFDEAQRKAGV